MEYINYLKMSNLNKIINYVCDNYLNKSTIETFNENVTYILSNIYKNKKITNSYEIELSDTQIISYVECVEDNDYIIHK